MLEPAERQLGINNITNISALAENIGAIPEDQEALCRLDKNTAALIKNKPPLEITLYLSEKKFETLIERDLLTLDSHTVAEIIGFTQKNIGSIAIRESSLSLKGLLETLREQEKIENNQQISIVLTSETVQPPQGVPIVTAGADSAYKTESPAKVIADGEQASDHNVVRIDRGTPLGKPASSHGQQGSGQPQDIKELYS